jgi:uncharacterized membrane protein
VEVTEALLQGLTQVQITVARFAGQLDGLVANQTDHESRLRALERWRWTLTGRLAAWSALGGTITGAIAAAIVTKVIGT